MISKKHKIKRYFLCEGVMCRVHAKLGVCHQVSAGDSWMYPDPKVPRHGKSLFHPYSSWVFMGYNPQESLENTINTMGTLFGVHPIVP